MNRPIVRLYGLVAVLFGLLVAFTSRWTIFEASSLRDNTLNARTLLERQRIARGPIVAADGTVLARSVRGREGVYQRFYPTGEEFAHAVGYYFLEPDLGSTGIERFRNSWLNGQSGTDLQSVLDQLQGKKPQGDKVITTLVPNAQRTALSALGGHEGAVLALDPRSGAVTVMASTPGYDPNALRSLRAYEGLTHDTAGRPLVNRATQFGYAPGSTFKVVTATAAIDSGDYTPESTVDGRNGVLISGVPLQNDQNESFGPITLTAALAHSVNTVWAQVAEHARQAHDGPLHGALRLRPQAAARLPGAADVDQRRVLPRQAHLADQPAGRRRPARHRAGQTRGRAVADGRGRRRRRE